MPTSETQWSWLHARLHQLVRQRGLMAKRDRGLVAVSGGQDSVCLLQLLVDLRAQWDWDIGVAHCDHRWSADEGMAAFVRELASRWDLPWHLRTADTLVTTEAAARQWRYQMLTDIAATENYAWVATGHTASDRAETLLYNLVRGSGADGLQALTWDRALGAGVRLVRPLLTTTRAETGDFCQQRHLPVWEDPSNQNLRYARNRLRLQVLPQLHDLNPQVELHLAQTAELLQADVAYLETLAADLLARATQVHPPALHRSPLRAAPLALQRRVCRQWLHQHLPQRPDFAHVEKLVALLDAPQGTQTDPFPGGAIARVRDDWVVLQAPSEQAHN